jgi:hypothetical protein
MTENELVYISLIMQLLIDGKANLNNLSPGVKGFLEGVIKEHNRDPEEELNFNLYHYATVAFNQDKEGMN